MSLNVPPHEGKKSILAIALAGGDSITVAAKKAGYSRKQANRIALEPGFQSEVSRFRGRILDRAAGKLIRATISAVDTLAKLIKQGTKEDGVRLQAAKIALEAALRVRELLDHEQRLTALESKNGR